MKKLLVLLLLVSVSLLFVGCGNGGSPQQEAAETEYVSLFEVIDRSEDAVTAYAHSDHWHGSLPGFAVGERLSLGAYMEDAEGEAIDYDDGYTLDATAEGEILRIVTHGDHIHVHAESAGETMLTFLLLKDGDIVYETPKMAVLVSDADAEAEVMITEFNVINRRAEGAIVANAHDDHWHGELPVVGAGGSVSLGAQILTSDGETMTLAGDRYLDVMLADGAEEGIVSFANHGDHVHIIGDAVGVTEVVFAVVEGEQTLYVSPAIEVEVE